MSTPFWQYSKKSLFGSKTSKVSELLTPAVPRDELGKLGLCMDYWFRQAEVIKINGVPLVTVLGKMGIVLDKKAPIDHAKAMPIFKQFWLNYLLPQKMPPKQKEKFINYYADYFYIGGGVMTVLTDKLWEIAHNKNCSLTDSGKKTKVNFILTDDKLDIIEEVDITEMADMRGRNTEIKTTTLRAQGNYSINFHSDPEITVDNIVLHNPDKLSAEVFDSRTLMQKIRDFFKSLIGNNELKKPTPTAPHRPSS